MKKQTLQEILGRKNILPYSEQAEYIMSLIDSGKIIPVKSSKRNGKKPSLYQEYWLCEKKEDYSDAINELKFRTTPEINIDYYLRHPEVYINEREDVRALNSYISRTAEKSNDHKAAGRVSYNERSFEIWGREKFITKGSAVTVLNHCKIPLERLNCCETVEPFSYFTADRSRPQNILILENKDPFYGMRNYLLEGNQMIFGIPIGTLVYGAGKRVLSSFRDFELSAEPYMLDPRNRFYYFGDLDYEGIGIFENLKNSISVIDIVPFVPAYAAMIKKAQKNYSLKGNKEGKISLPMTSEKQNKSIDESFFDWFSEETSFFMKEILSKNRYIPQEILITSEYGDPQYAL